MRTGRRPILALLCCLFCALVGVFAVSPTRSLAASVAINDTNFFDPVLRAYLKDPKIDTNQDGYLSDTEIKEVTDVDLSGTGLVELYGIQKLTSLKSIRIDGCQNITTANFFDMKSLETVTCSGCTSLYSFNIYGCPNVSVIDVEDCDLTALDLSGCPKLDTLYASGNHLAFATFDSGAPLTNVHLENQEDLRFSCSSGSDGRLYVSLATLAEEEGFTSFSSPNVKSYNSADGWAYDSSIGVFSNPSALNAMSNGLTYTYNAGGGKTLQVHIRILTTPVRYSWTNAPQGAKLPVNNRGYLDLESVKASMDMTYYKGYTINAANGTYVFSGWNVPSDVDDYGVFNFTGSWTLYSASGASNWTRVWGQDHYDTAAAVCSTDKVFSSTGGTVVLATGESYWDALSASGLAGLYRAPILITPGSHLGDQARSEMKRLMPSRVIVMGGWMAVSDSTLAAVRAAVPYAKVERCYGQAQDDTARAAFQAAPRSSWGDTCVVATSNGYWDALSIAPYAYSRHAPIFLTRGGADAQNVLSPATMSAIRSAGFKRVVVVGGTMAVPASVESSLRASGLTVTRLWGQDHYDTSAAIAKWELSQGMTTAHMAVSTGRGYWDALSGAALVGAQGSVVAIADDGHLQAIDAAGARVAGNVQGGYVLGGEMAVSNATWKYITTPIGGGSGGAVG